MLLDELETHRMLNSAAHHMLLAHDNDVKLFGLVKGVNQTYAALQTLTRGRGDWIVQI